MWPLSKRAGHKKSAKRGARQAQSLKRRRFYNRLIRSLSIMVIAFATIAGVYIWKSGLFQQWKLEAGDIMDREIAGAGFMIREVRITGQQQTSLKQIRASLALYDGQSIISLDLEKMLRRLEKLPWIRKATITRIMPDILEVKISEHQAAALWQQNDRLYLVNPDGKIITGEGAGDFTTLPHVVGTGANDNLPALLAMKDKFPALFAKVESAIWVGRRRWDLHFRNGMIIKLPEDGTDLAWARLNDYVRNRNILEKEILSIDMRLSGKTIMRLTPREAERRRMANGSTSLEESI